MDNQTLINFLIAAVGAAIGWILNNIKASIDDLRISHKDLQKADLELADKVQHIELLVAGTYVKREELEKMLAAVFNKLDKIDAKLDAKKDRADCGKFNITKE